MTTFAVFTLGCKVNFYESEWISERLAASGFTHLNGLSTCPDWVIVNTCTVTKRADRQSRQVIYQTARRCPETKIVVTGCYADRDSETLMNLPNVGRVVRNKEKIFLPDTIAAVHKTHTPRVMLLNSFKGRQRAYLMIQNGCNARCSYCVIPSVRGKSRSKPPEAVLREIDDLSKSGHPEIVLCGIHLGQYGQDLSPRTSLSLLLREIEDHPFGGRVRISSIEPMELTEGVIQRVANSERICPHFHIPLQSGSSEILRKMNRPYTPESFKMLIRSIKTVSSDCTIGSDVMVGFPGETDEAFEETYKFLSSLPFSYLHIFPYSERPGTASQSLPGKVSEAAKKSRVSRLLKLARRKREEFFTSWIGRSDDVVFEKRRGRNLWVGKSDHYLPVRVKSGNNLLGTRREVKIISAESDYVWGAV